MVKKTRLLRVIDGWMPGSGLSSKARQVLRYMMDKGDSPEVRDDGEMVVRNIYPTKKTMAARLGVSTRTIDRACEELALRGMLAWETLPPKRNRYLLHIPPEVTAEVIGTGQGNDGTDASTGHPDASAGHPDASTRPGDASMRQGDASKDQNPSPESITLPHHQTRGSENDRLVGGGGGGGCGVVVSGGAEVEALLVAAGVSATKAREIRQAGVMTADQVRSFIAYANKSPELKNPASWLGWACMQPETAQAMVGASAKGGSSRRDKFQRLTVAQEKEQRNHAYDGSWLNETEPTPAPDKAARKAEAERLAVMVEPVLRSMGERDLHDLLSFTLRAMIDDGTDITAYIDAKRWFGSPPARPGDPIGKCLLVDPRASSTNALALRAAIGKRFSGWHKANEYQLATASERAVCQ